jgi:hypothetical protein
VKLKTKIFGMPVFTTEVDGKASVDVPSFTLLSFSGVRTRTKVKGPFGITLGKTKGWVLTPFDVTSGPIHGDGTIDGGP